MIQGEEGNQLSAKTQIHMTSLSLEKDLSIMVKKSISICGKYFKSDNQGQRHNSLNDTRP